MLKKTLILLALTVGLAACMDSTAPDDSWRRDAAAARAAARARDTIPQPSDTVLQAKPHGKRDTEEKRPL
jgi:hypothetical protein